ncbi:HWE histidine kinase domain-containing protein [Aurantimonas sp. C2-6-R+9]|uniref:sensor histidine kinase n=1 Tax=unclassified Aurantimonas TaxID=2638230 RepID=UPI002E17A4EC|nr:MULTISPECIES: HWE histidine kinase domain-containing protein [unclassified Aurantimonas]MEC5290515.1 HWE histidine kinase domain-containing protein [Aurantimonas sp. C2-3-R2]MEC5380476.1 HWE histidine kinase domain-containing protein [Aurantimonas sp. C2-6-R+9]MEC5411522.1 HWE histidine kinase domain-containing protein [Aurantimonas sp. C2-4-R8]
MKSLEFERLFEALPSPYMVLDSDLRYVAVNRAYENAVMRTRADLVGEKLFDMFPNEGEGGRRLTASFDEVLKSGAPDTIAFIPYEIPRPAEAGGEFEQRYWTATHTPLKNVEGKVEFIIQNTIDVTEIVRLKEASSVPFRAVPSELALLKHAQNVEEAYQTSVSQAEEFRGLFRQAPGMIAVLQGPDHVFTFVNDSYSRFIGGRDTIGRSVRAAIPEIEGQGFFEMLDEVYSKGRSFSGEGVRVMIRSQEQAEPIESFIDFSYNPIRDAAGEISGVFVQGFDRTESIRAAQRQRVLIDELNHRVKNTLSTVQAMARQSFRNITDPEEARYAFEARIMALSQAHDVLSARRWEAAGLSVLLRQELAGFDPARVRMVGPEVHLTSKSAIALAMVFHELATNANRHGAMATAAGTLEVEWTVSERGARRHLAVTWREALEDAPERELTSGFGVRMLRRIIEGELAGTLSLDLGNSSLICRFDVALSEVDEFEISAA